MLLSHHQNAGQNRDIKVTTVTNQHFIQEEIKRLNTGIVCYLSVQNLPSFHLLYRKVKSRIKRDYNFVCGSVSL
jgi:hypothetical protein